MRRTRKVYTTGQRMAERAALKKADDEAVWDMGKTPTPKPKPLSDLPEMDILTVFNINSANMTMDSQHSTLCLHLCDCAAINEQLLNSFMSYIYDTEFPVRVTYEGKAWLLHNINTNPQTVDHNVIGSRTPLRVTVGNPTYDLELMSVDRGF